MAKVKRMVEVEDDEVDEVAAPVVGVKDTPKPIVPKAEPKPDFTLQKRLSNLLKILEARDPKTPGLPARIERVKKALGVAK